jgi:hypothetical protein
MGRGTPQSGLPNPSFTHLIHLDLTPNDDLQLETANRPVPCKNKGIRGFPDNFGFIRIKAVAFSQSLAQMRPAQTPVAGENVPAQGAHCRPPWVPE